MKKHAFLMLGLTLAACGGGSGGGGDHNVGQGFEPSKINMPTNTQVWNGATNQEVTAKLTDTDLIKFNVGADGKINQITYDERVYEQQGDTNRYVNTDWINNEINLVTMGKAAGLKYADFGYMQETQTNKYGYDRDIEVFAGGAPSNQFIGVMPMIKATYTGTAVAYIQSETPLGITNQISVTDDASLVIDKGGVQKVAMNFSKADNPWYDVVFENGWNVTLVDNGNVPENLKATAGMKQSKIRASNDFYGADADEVIQRLEVEYKDNAGHELEFKSAFGGTRQ